MLFRASANAIFNQLDYLFAHLPAEVYAMPLSALRGSSVGGHVRHILEFYQCLAQGYTTGAVDYDARQRNEVYETDMQAAQAAFDRVEQHFLNLQNRELVLKATVGRKQPLVRTIQSSFDRELIYLAEHAMHHLAIIRFGLLAHYPDFHFPTDFGMAESTLRYRETVH